MLTALAVSGGARPPNGEMTWVARRDLGFFAVTAPLGASPAAAAFALVSTSEALAEVELPPSSTLEPKHRARLRAAISRADAMWTERVKTEQHNRGIGAAFAGVLFDADQVAVGHAGDCRVYQARQGHFIRQTVDHVLFDARERRVVVRGIGLGSNPEVVSWPTEPGDMFLLTAGVHEHLTEAELLAALGEWPRQRAPETILDLAMSRGATDHQSVLLVASGDESAG